MNLNELKAKYIQYLSDKGELDNEKLSKLTSGLTSVFFLGSDFAQFVKENLSSLGIKNTNKIPNSVSEILAMIEEEEEDDSVYNLFESKETENEETSANEADDDKLSLLKLDIESLIKTQKGENPNSDNQNENANLEDTMSQITGKDVISEFKAAGVTTKEFDKILSSLKNNSGKYTAMIDFSAEDKPFTLKDIDGNEINTFEAGTNYTFGIKAVDEDGVTIVNPLDSSKEYKISLDDARKFATGIQYFAIDDSFKEADTFDIEKSDKEPVQSIEESQAEDTGESQAEDTGESQAEDTAEPKAEDAAEPKAEDAAEPKAENKEAPSSENNTKTAGNENTNHTNTNNTHSSGGAGGNTGTGDSVNNNNTPADTAEDLSKKDINDMSLDELKTYKTDVEKQAGDVQNSVKEKQTDINNAKQASSDSKTKDNEVVNAAQEEYNNAEKEYKEALGKDEYLNSEEGKQLKENINNNLEAIDNAQIAQNNAMTVLNEANNKKIQANDKVNECSNNVINAKSAVTLAEGTVAGLEVALASYDKMKEDDNDAKSDKALLEVKLSAAKADLEEKQKELQKAQDTLNTAKEELTAAEKAVTDAQTGYNTATEELNKANEIKAELDTKLTENCSDEIQKALEIYNSAKMALDTAKKTQKENADKNQTAIDTAQKAMSEEIQKLSEAQAVVDKVNSKINEKETKKDNSLNNNFFSENVNYVTETVKDSSGMTYVVMKPNDVGDDEELPMLMYLHGLGEKGFSGSQFRNSSVPNLITKGANNFQEDFRGYIVFPILQKGYWGDKTCNVESQLRSIVNNFTAEHKVDKDNIALAGYSLGGIGAIYMAKHMGDIFSRATVISGLAAGDKNGEIDISSINIPLKGYVGTVDGSASKYMNEKFSDLTVLDTNHGGMQGAALLRDKDKNGRSDFFEELFPSV